jgi:DNA (cytosine-5)-methyltransferase 1
MKILNLYAGIGGNRRLWGDEHEITAVELDYEIGNIYAALYPNDNLVMGDAHEYLLENFKEFDFIWSSPPCPTHSRVRKINAKAKPVYPNMSLYEEILLLKYYYKGKWVVENVVPFYEYLIKPDVIVGRHPYWTNIQFPQIEVVKNKIGAKRGENAHLAAIHGIDVNALKMVDTRKVLRNMVDPKVGLHILQHAQDPDQN